MSLRSRISKERKGYPNQHSGKEAFESVLIADIALIGDVCMDTMWGLRRSSLCFFLWSPRKEFSLMDNHYLRIYSAKDMHEVIQACYKHKFES